MLHHHDVIRMTLYHKSLCQRCNLILAIMIGITKKGNNSLVQLIIGLILSVLKFHSGRDPTSMGIINTIVSFMSMLSESESELSHIQFCIY